MRPRGGIAWLAVMAVVLVLALRTRAAQEDEEEVILGRPTAGFEDPSRERVTVEAGARIRLDPDVRSPSLAVVDVASELVVLERRGAWVRVRYAGLNGWWLGDVTADNVPEEAGGAPRSGWVGPGSELERLIHAREILGIGDQLSTLGPYGLLTDLDDEALLEFLGSVAREVPGAYQQRYSVGPGEPAHDVVVLFATEEAYRDYQSREAAIAGLQFPGHAVRGVAALFVGDSRRESVAGLLVHELTHLLNRHALGDGIPAWLEEGLADGLAFSRIDASGRLEASRLGGGSSVNQERLWLAGGSVGTVTTQELSGPRAALSGLVEAMNEGRAPQLSVVVELPWSQFVAPDRCALHYAQAGFFVRYLLDAEKGRWAAGFHAYLAAVAGGGSGDGAALLEALSGSWVELEEGFQSWVRRQGRRMSR
jgi:hypothetical protein